MENIKRDELGCEIDVLHVSYQHETGLIFDTAPIDGYDMTVIMLHEDTAHLVDYVYGSPIDDDYCVKAAIDAWLDKKTADEINRLCERQAAFFSHNNLLHKADVQLPDTGRYKISAVRQLKVTQHWLSADHYEMLLVYSDFSVMHIFICDGMIFVADCDYNELQRRIDADELDSYEAYDMTDGEPYYLRSKYADDICSALMYAAQRLLK